MAESPILTLGPEHWMTGIRTGDFTDTDNGLFGADRHLASALYRPDAYQGLLRPPNGIYNVTNDGLVDTVIASTTRDVGTNTQLFQIGHGGHLYQSVIDLIHEPYYNIKVAAHNATLDVSTEDNRPQGLAWNNDGSKLFIVGVQNQNVYEYNLSTNYDVTTATYSTNSLDVSSEDTFPSSITWNNDGSKLYIAGGSNDSIFSYNLSTNYDITTASYSNNSLDVSTETSSPTSITWNSDGSTLIVLGGDLDDGVLEYDASTAYDISTASYASTKLDIDDQDSAPNGMAWNSDGSKMYIVGGGNNNIYEYELSINYSPTSAEFTQKIGIGSEDTAPEGIAWNNDGSKLYMVGEGNDNVYQYDMNLNTSLRVGNEINTPANGLATFKPKNGTEYLYYTTSSGIGRWDLSGIYPTGWDDTWHTSNIETTVEKPMYEFQDRIYFANDSFVGFIGDDGAGGVEVNPTALDIPSKYHITSFSDDGRRLIIAATKQEQSGQVTSHAGSKIFFWDTNSDSWNKAWEIDQSTGIASIRTVRGVTYALDTSALYKLSYNSPPEEVVEFQIDETGNIGLQEFSSNTSYVENNIDGVANHQKMIKHRQGVMWFNGNENLTFYGQYTSEQPEDVLDVMWGTYDNSNIIASTTGQGFTMSGHSNAYVTDEFDFGRITISADKATEWIFLEDRYDITSIEVVFGYDLDSGDELELRVATDQNVFRVFGNIDFATYGSVKRVRLFGDNLNKIDSLKLNFEFIGGQPYVQNVLVYGDKVSM